MTTAVILENPRELHLRDVELAPQGEGDVLVETAWSGISTGTERLLWTGEMPTFPGMGYPLVPGYESVGRVQSAGPKAQLAPGTLVFVPGSHGFKDLHCLFGGAGSHLVAPSEKVIPIPEDLGAEGVLLALAATAHHALVSGETGHYVLPELIVGHGVLGRLIARLVLALGGEPPVVWEVEPGRQTGGDRYTVCQPAEDPRTAYASICDCSGASDLLDELISKLKPGGEIVLAGFYAGRLDFAFAPAFMREARFRIAAEFKPQDVAAVLRLLADKRLSLAGLITHRAPAAEAAGAYRTAFEEADCLKMILEWRAPQ